MDFTIDSSVTVFQFFYNRAFFTVPCLDLTARICVWTNENFFRQTTIYQLIDHKLQQGYISFVHLAYRYVVSLKAFQNLFKCIKASKPTNGYYFCRRDSRGFGIIGVRLSRITDYFPFSCVNLAVLPIYGKCVLICCSEVYMPCEQRNYINTKSILPRYCRRISHTFLAATRVPPMLNFLLWPQIPLCPRQQLS